MIIVILLFIMFLAIAIAQALTMFSLTWYLVFICGCVAWSMTLLVMEVCILMHELEKKIGKRLDR